MSFKVAHVGSLTKNGDEIITGASNHFVDGGGGGGGGGGGAITAVSNFGGTIVVFREADAYTLDDDVDGVIIPPHLRGPENETGEESTASNSALGQAVNCAGLSGQISYATKLSPNFTLADVTVQTHFGRQGNGTIRPQNGLSASTIVCNLKGVCVNLLEPFAAQFGRNKMLLTSGFRHGSGTSKHTQGLAVDVQIPSFNEAQLWAAAQWVQANLPYDALLYECRGNRPWLHLQYCKPGQTPRKIVETWPNGTSQTKRSGLHRIRF